MDRLFGLARASGAVGVAVVSMVLGGSPAKVLAQEPPGETQQERPRFEDKVEVTGSLIPRPTLEALSPVAVLEPDEIARSGVTRLEDLLQTLPQVYNGQNSTINNGATGTATVDLRHLGEVRTLVLVNGRRLPTGDAWSIVPDLNFIPAGLVKRIDVLTGGASSVYGADAVAGVVNFVLDTELEGFKGGVEYGAYQHDNRNRVAQEMNAAAGYAYPTGNIWDGDVASAYAALGGKLAGGRGHATVYLDYRHIDGITKDQRDYTACATNLSPLGLMCGGAAATPAGLFTVYDRFFTTNTARDYVLDLSTDQMRPATPYDVYNYAPFNYMQRPDERWLAGGFISYEFNPHVEGYAEVMFMDDFTEVQLEPSGDLGSTYLLNCDNPMLSEQQRELFCTELGFSDDEYAHVVVNRRSVETGPLHDAVRHTAWRLLGGARGQIDKVWTYDVYGLHADVQITESLHNEVSVSRMADALDVVGDPGDPNTWRCRSGNPTCVPWNIFSAGGVTRAAADFIRTTANSQSSTRTEILDGRLNGDLEGYGVKLPGASEGIQVAVGALYRREVLTFDPDEVYRSGDAAAVGTAVLPVNGAYSVKELYLEGRVPVLQERAGARDLTLELGYRYSDYTLAGSHPTYKAQLSWTPVSGLKLRGSLARAVRAPNVVELFAPEARGFGGYDPCQTNPKTGVPMATLEQCMRTGVTAEQYGHILPNPWQYGASMGVFAGNPRLAPETGDTRTFGVVITPPGAPGLTAAVDYYDTRMEDTIGAPDGIYILLTCLRTGDPGVCDRIHRDATGSLWLTPDGYIVQTNENIGELRSRGVDVNASYLLPVGKAGYVNLNVIGTYLLEDSLTTAWLAYDCVGYFAGMCGEPDARWRHRASLSWETGFDAVLSLTWRMIGPSTFSAASPDPDLAVPDPAQWAKAMGSDRLDTYHVFDLSATYDVSDQVQLTLGVNNVLDKEPPMAAGIGFNAYGTGFHGSYDPYGRFIHASLRFNF